MNNMGFDIDNHKLGLHPYEVGRWLNGESIFPVSIEVSPSGNCNNHCVFCSQSRLGYVHRFINTQSLLFNLRDMRHYGTKSIVFAGEGEPLLHPDISDIVCSTKTFGLDGALSTNAVLLTESKAKNILEYLTWIRISLNACNADMYSRVHGTKSVDYMKVLGNISDAVTVKKSQKIGTTIGVQYVLYSENCDQDGIIAMARQLKDFGVDYFSIKPYSVYPHLPPEIKGVNIVEITRLCEELESLSTSEFSVIIRKNAFHGINNPKTYSRCLGMPFWSYIDSASNVWPCLSFIGEPEYLLGNIDHNTYLEIIKSPAYRNIFTKITTMDISMCRKPCRLESINEYLQILTQDMQHRNFI